jgi:hypothetical protein
MLYIRYLGKDYPAADDPSNWLGPEATSVEKHYGADLMAGDGDPRKMTTRQSAYAIAYVTLKREHRTFTWDVIERMTLLEVANMFVNLDENGNEFDASDTEEASPAEVLDPPVNPVETDRSMPSGTPTDGDS